MDIQHRSIILFMTLTILLVSCYNNKQEIEMPALYPPPVKVKLNTEEGYLINPLTGDSIQALINSLGDTIKTGVPIPVQGNVIHPDSVGQVIIIPAGEPQAVPINRSVFKIPENLTIIPVDKDKLKTFTPGLDTTSHVLFHPSGDAIPTGIPIQTKGKLVPSAQAKPVNALPPLRKRNARMNIRYLDKNQGLSSNYISRIYEDNDGNLWFGTMGGGVSKYNGNSFMHFTEEEGLSKNVVRSIHEDQHGNLWFGTDGGGISMYNGETFTHYTEKEGLINNTIYSIAEDSDGNLWFGTQDGVSKFNGSTFTHFTEEEGLSWNTVRSVHEDKHGNLWFGTEHGGLSMYNGETFTHLTENEGLISNTIYSIAEDSDGNLWFATGGGINMYDGQAITDFSKITEREKLNYNTVTTVLEDSNGNLWFGTYGGGLSMYDGESYTHITENDGLSNNYITSILEDSNGNLWFGTNGSGVNLYDVNSFTPYADIEELSSIPVTSILEDRQDNLWFGTENRGVFIYDGKTYKHITEKEGLRYNGVYTMLEDSHNNIWLSYRWGRGVAMFNGKTFTHFTGVGLYNNHVLATLEDDQGNLWFTKTGHGITKYDGEIFTTFSEKEGLSQNTITSVIQDTKGKLWFGTYERGLSKYDGTYITHYTEKEGLANNFVLSIFEDSHGNLWIGTEGGLSIYNGETFTQFTENEGLSNSAVQSILEDNNNNIWIGTKDGLNYFSFNRDRVFSSTGSYSRSVRGEDREKAPYNDPFIYTYSKADGLSGIEFYQHAATLDKKNRIWWGSNKGFTVLDMNEFHTPVEPPAIQLTQIDINEYGVDYHHLEDHNEMGLKFDGVAKFNNYPLNLELPFNCNHLTFHFLVLDWAAPDKIRYSFKMEGLNDHWSQLTEEHKADYRNMPYGTFTFVVRAIGEAQKWSVPFEYSFTINPPWWRTWWAIVTECFLALSILLVIVRYREGKQKQRALLLEQEVQEKTQQMLEQGKEVDEMKNRFYANISHEFRTPLTLLISPIEDAMKQGPEKIEISKRIISIMHRNARRLQNLINQLLDISKIESGKMELQLSKTSLSDFARVVASSFYALAESRQIQYRIDIEADGEDSCFDADKTEKIIMNLLSNAFKFCEDGGSVSMELEFISISNKYYRWALIKVNDNGKGMEEKQLDKIFDRFYQVSDHDSREVEGSGIGLALTRELLELMHGSIQVESTPGKGTSFQLAFPISEEGFSEQEIETMIVGKTLVGNNILDEIEPSILPESAAETQWDEMVLVVEDNPDLRAYISLQLKNKYTCIEAGNGKEGLDFAFELIPDLIISDLMMPVMNGMKMCRELKKDPRTSHIPIIMLTARAEWESKAEGLEIGADDYLIKPFDTRELKARIRNLIVQRIKLKDKFWQDFLTLPLEKTLLSPKDQLLQKITEILRENISEEDFNVDKMSEELNMSKRQLYRKVKAVSGYAPNELLRNIRLKEAATLFDHGEHNVARVMYEVGFNNQSYFTKCFNKQYQMNPSVYIKRKST